MENTVSGDRWWCGPSDRTSDRWRGDGSPTCRSWAQSVFARLKIRPSLLLACLNWRNCIREPVVRLHARFSEEKQTRRRKHSRRVIFSLLRPPITDADRATISRIKFYLIGKTENFTLRQDLCLVCGKVWEAYARTRLYAWRVFPRHASLFVLLCMCLRMV